MKKLDWYILKKFLGTFVYAISLLLVVVIVFDFSEKIEDFIQHKPPFKEIVLDYYLNFIPYFANLFSHLFTFIAVIFFTSRMAARSEIVAILSSGVSFWRLLRPYMIGATIIAAGSLYLNNFVIPQANRGRLDFEEKYVRGTYYNNARNIHLQIQPGTFAYVNGFDVPRKTGFSFRWEKFNGNDLLYQLKADHIIWDSIKGVWHIFDYKIREFKGLHEPMRSGYQLDTVIQGLNVKDFTLRSIYIEAMTGEELVNYIKEQKMKGAENVEEMEIAKHSRIAFPFATFILTLIGVSLASRKVRGGIGMHIGLGLAISFSYIVFMQISSVFAQKGVTPAYIAVWIPNVVYALLA
ncbi:MAG TPA: LptF/LptG family permease, partial [Bacteroidia bacterium]|nr:LptF/LptG family permease [Bacteroidia bacterium]